MVAATKTTCITTSARVPSISNAPSEATPIDMHRPANVHKLLKGLKLLPHNGQGKFCYHCKVPTRSAVQKLNLHGTCQEHGMRLSLIEEFQPRHPRGP